MLRPSSASHHKWPIPANRMAANGGVFIVPAFSGLFAPRWRPDARGVIVSLTDDGMRRLRAAAPEHVESVRRVVFDHMTPEQQTHVKAFIEGVLAVSNVPGHPDFCGSFSEPAGAADADSDC